jgi:hypothetical protein
MGKPSPSSAKIKIGIYVLDKMKGVSCDSFTKEELQQAAGISGPWISDFLAKNYPGMFSSRGKKIHPNTELFDDKDKYLEQLDFMVRVYTNNAESSGASYSRERGK